MKIATNSIPPSEALKWYSTMGVDVVVSTDSDRWHPKNNSLEKQNIKKDKGAAMPSLNMKNLDTNISSSRKIADAASSIEELKSALLAFNGCELKKTATNTVFSDGISSAKIMLLGEAPGANEDAQGIPFCGESGKLLDNMLNVIGLSRKENIYITNTIFWRPPANRRPTQEEIEICRPFVEKHIALIQPKLLVLVGATAVTSLLGGDLQISKIRQEYYQYQNQYMKHPITTTAIFHPAYLLRQPFQKKASWYDLLKLQEFIDSAV